MNSNIEAAVIGAVVVIALTLIGFWRSSIQAQSTELKTTLSGHDSRITGLETKSTGYDKDFAAVGQRFDRIETHLERQDVKMDAQTSRLDMVLGKLGVNFHKDES